jgi:hypothetical protein
MKLPHQSQPTLRDPADIAARQAAAGVAPASVRPQNGWKRGKPGKNSGECTCYLDKKLGYWRPNPSNCGYLGVPQCTSTGGCNCVRKNDQNLGGATQDITGVQGLYQALNVT